MPQEPKKRHSRARQGKRRAAIHLAVSKTVLCANCKTPVLAHMVCKHCGFYKGKEVLGLLARKEKRLRKKQSQSNEQEEVSESNK
jgi:large subunit ribosomal protein L32